MAVIPIDFQFVEPLGSDGGGPFQPVSSIKQDVIQNIKATLLTEPGEHLMRADGSPLAALIGEPGDEATQHLARAVVEEQITKYEPRFVISLIRVSLEDVTNLGQVSMKIEVFGNIVTTGEPTSFAFVIGFGRAIR